MGGFDVFKAQLNPCDSTFRKAENGYPVANSVLDDIYFVISADSYNAYFTSNNQREGAAGNGIFIMPKPQGSASVALFAAR